MDQSGDSRTLSGLLVSRSRTSAHSIGNLLPLMMRIQMARDCAAGLAFLHSKGFMHCDIKSLNYLGTLSTDVNYSSINLFSTSVTSDFSVKLADLGEARRLSEKGSIEDVRQLPR